MGDLVYQASDLAGARRTEFLKEARAGRARLRDKDGVSLVMLPEAELSTLERFAQLSRFANMLQTAASRDEPLSLMELGEFAWLRVFDSEDLEDFRSELWHALVASLADKRLDVLELMLNEWRITARQMDDPLRRSVLTASHETSEYEVAPAPEVDD